MIGIVYFRILLYGFISVSFSFGVFFNDSFQLRRDTVWISWVEKSKRVFALTAIRCIVSFFKDGWILFWCFVSALPCNHEGRNEYLSGTLCIRELGRMYFAHEKRKYVSVPFPSWYATMDPLGDDARAAHMWYTHTSCQACAQTCTIEAYPSPKTYSCCAVYTPLRSIRIVPTHSSKSPGWADVVQLNLVYETIVPHFAHYRWSFPAWLEFSWACSH